MFEIWLRTVCFQAPTKEAYDLAKCAWEEATKAEREACAKTCEGIGKEIVCPEECAEAIRSR
jgi:hypothetical protein